MALHTCSSPLAHGFLHWPLLNPPQIFAPLPVVRQIMVLEGALFWRFPFPFALFLPGQLLMTLFSGFPEEEAGAFPFLFRVRRCFSQMFECFTKA